MVMVTISKGQKMYYINYSTSTIEEVVFQSFIDNEIANKNRVLFVKNISTGTIFKGIYNKDLFFKRSNARNVFNDTVNKDYIKTIEKIEEGNRRRNQIAIESRSFNVYE